MDDFELVFLAELYNKAYHQEGVIGIRANYLTQRTEIQFSEEDFLAKFQDYRVEDYGDGDYLRVAHVDYIRCFCLVDGKDLNAKDLEELEWSGELRK